MGLITIDYGTISGGESLSETKTVSYSASETKSDIEFSSLKHIKYVFVTVGNSETSIASFSFYNEDISTTSYYAYSLSSDTATRTSRDMTASNAVILGVNGNKLTIKNNSSTSRVLNIVAIGI